MDLKVFYTKMRQLESTLEESHVVLVSQETADGGRAGVLSEVPKHVAAKMVVEGRARLATAEETAAFREEIAEAKRVQEQIAASRHMQITVLSEADLRALKSSGKKS